MMIYRQSRILHLVYSVLSSIALHHDDSTQHSYIFVRSIILYTFVRGAGQQRDSQSDRQAFIFPTRYIPVLYRSVVSKVDSRPFVLSSGVATEEGGKWGWGAVARPSPPDSLTRGSGSAPGPRRGNSLQTPAIGSRYRARQRAPSTLQLWRRHFS